MNRLKELRKRNNLTQQDMANLLFTTQQNYSRYEKGQIEPDYKTLKQLSNYFQVSIEYILGYEETEFIAITKEEFQKLKIASDIIQNIDKSLQANKNDSNIAVVVGNNNKINQTKK